MNEEEEREFWSNNDSTEYINWESAEKIVLYNLKPSTKKISFRLPEIMIEDLKFLANKRDIPYQSFNENFFSRAYIPRIKHKLLIMV